MAIIMKVYQVLSPNLGSAWIRLELLSKKLGSASAIFQKTHMEKIGKTSLEFHVTLFDQAKAANEFWCHF